MVSRSPESRRRSRPADPSAATSAAWGPSAAAGDILHVTHPPTGPVTVWASFAALGLGPNDDLDALIVRDNGNGVFDPSVVPFDWMSGATDLVVFSVRRSSPLVGTRDAFFGVPIEEGDVLTVTGGGGVPGILIAAERLGAAHRPHPRPRHLRPRRRRRRPLPTPLLIADRGARPDRPEPGSGRSLRPRPSAREPLGFITS